jgi:hypothetical protein
MELFLSGIAALDLVQDQTSRATAKSRQFARTSAACSEFIY